MEWVQKWECALMLSHAGAAPHSDPHVQPGDLPQPLVRADPPRVDTGLCLGQLGAGG